MNNKYYTPDIKEFHVGFECEFFNAMKTDIWEKEICDWNLLNLANDTFEHGTDYDCDDMRHSFRVKYLDKEDIESLGFKLFGNSKFRPNGFKFHLDSNIYLEFIAHDYPLRFTFIEDNTNIEKLFCEIRCKNKSELKKLLIQLGINEQSTK